MPVWTLNAHISKYIFCNKNIYCKATVSYVLENVGIFWGYVGEWMTGLEIPSMWSTEEISQCNAVDGAHFVIMM